MFLVAFVASLNLHQRRFKERLDHEETSHRVYAPTELFLYHALPETVGCATGGEKSEHPLAIPPPVFSLPLHNPDILPLHSYESRTKRAET